MDALQIVNELSGPDLHVITLTVVKDDVKTARLVFEFRVVHESWSFCHCQDFSCN